MPKPGPKQRRRRAVWLGAAIALAVAVGGGALWWKFRPIPTVLEAPELTADVEARLLAALHEGYPTSKPLLKNRDGNMPAESGKIMSIAAADVNGDGTPEWGVAYAWMGKKDGTGARPIQPGFAVLQDGDEPTVVLHGPALGGWSSADDAVFEDVSRFESRVDAVSLAPGEFAFMQHVTVESALGGRQVQGRARLFGENLKGWAMIWDGETESLMAQGNPEETGRGAEVTLQDVNGDERVEVLASPNWYRRKLGEGAPVHFSASGPGQYVYQRFGDKFQLAGFLPQGSTAYHRIREATPLFAVKAPGPVRIDGAFGEWGHELVELSGMRLEDPKLIKYKRRDRRGIEDNSADIRLMWDRENLYVRATVVDDHVVPGAAGRDLYKGDHLAVWIDRDLAGDFDQRVRTDDDWQIGFTPGSPGAAYAWVPKPGRHGLAVASRPHVDPYSGGVYGYELEAAIPWSTLGGTPEFHERTAIAASASGRMRTYELTAAAILGAALVLTDSDEQAQELVYVSHPGFAWAEPFTFNTLFLVQ
jgi:hypothetical protein